MTWPADHNTALLRVRGLRKRYDTPSYALDGVSFDVRAGEVVAVIGPSGAGKSTLLRCINRLVEPGEGEIYVEGCAVRELGARALTRLRSRIGMIFQHHNLIPRTSVLTNVRHGRLAHTPFYRSLAGAYTQEDTAEAHALLAAVGLEGFARRRASTLSGGQAQRVGICRALMQHPRILLADEPIASLDPAASETVMACIKKATVERNLACIVNLHQVSYAKKYATRIIGLREGVIVFDGPPEALTDEVVAAVYAEREGTAAAARPKAPAGGPVPLASTSVPPASAPVTPASLPISPAGRRAKAFALTAVGLALFLAFYYIRVNPFVAFTSFPVFLRFFYANFLPPHVGYITDNFTIIWARVADTFFFAVVGTYISAVLAFFLGLLMSREMNRVKPLRLAVRAFVSVLRNVPLLIWATVIVFIFGVGAMVGVSALVLATLGFLARSYADSMDEIAATRLEALRSTGAGWWQVLFHGLVPSFVPSWINWTLFSFEINIRASAVLGMVGAGGLGFLIQVNLDLRGFTRAMSLIVILILMVLATEYAVTILRKRLARPGTLPEGWPPALRRVMAWVPPAAVVALFFFSANRLDLHIATFVSRMQNAGHVLSRFWAFNPAALPEIFRQLLISVSIGIGALASGFVISIVLAFLAAENIAPVKWVGYIIKGAVSLVRAVPSLVLILVVVKSLGFGPAAAVAGLTFACVGYLTRAFIASIEEQERAAIDAMRTAGAGWLQIVVHGLIPGVFTAFVAWLAIRLEANISDSVSIGMIGAGGVGMLVSRAVRQLNFANLTTTMVVIIVAMLLVEVLAQWLRRKIT